MNVRAVITVILGLVFQLAQVSPVAADTSPCTSQAASCACCEGTVSCHCAENGDSKQKPAPISSDSASILKSPAARSADTRVSIESPDETHPASAMAASPVAGPSSGYRGVSLSVAFCSFVI